jgi:hypothetical protein
VASRLVRASVASAALLDRFVRALRAAHSGFWLGILGTRRAGEATEAFYARSARFGDDHFTRSGLFEWETAAIVNHTSPGSRVLVPAAGSGREVIALTNMGYRAIGYDPNPVLVRSGRSLIDEIGSAAELWPSEGAAIPDDIGGRFDAVLFGWGGVSHIVGSRRRTETFRQLIERLEPDGVAIVSFLWRSDDSTTFRTIHRIATTIRRILRSDELPELGDSSDGSFDHHFTFDEIAAELATVGFVEIERIRMPYAHIVVRKP